MKNKILKIILLSVVIILSISCFFACAGDDASGSKKGLLMKKMGSDDTYTVYDYVDDGTLTNGVLDIAAIAGEGKVVGRIKTNAFYGADNIKKLIVPQTVTQIDQGAFANMKNLEELVIPFVGYNAVADTYYGESATADEKSVDKMRTFGYMFGTEEYQFGQKITQVYDGKSSSFDYYVPMSLRTVTVSPKENYGIPMYAFYGNSAISTVKFDEKVTVIGDYAMANTMYLSNVVITPSITKIGKGAFKDCVKLNQGLDLTNATSLLVIDDNAFENAGVENIVIPSSVTEIGSRVFKNSKIVTVDLGAINAISSYAFYGCEKLTTVTTVATEIEAYAFYGCKALKSFNSANENEIRLVNVTVLDAMSFAELGSNITTNNVFDWVGGLDRLLVAGFVQG